MKLKVFVGIALGLFFVSVTAIFSVAFFSLKKTVQKTVSSNQPSPSPLPSQTFLTINEVQKHNLSSDCWLIINNKIYDVTTFISSHPGGANSVLPYCGKEATEAFKTKDVKPSRNHTNSATNLLDQYYIGTLGQAIASAPTPTQGPTVGPGTPTPTTVIFHPIVIIPTATSPPKAAVSQNNLTLNAQEVANHNTLQNCWLIINNKIYDVTTYITQHPGGVQMIVNFCGKEATTAFNTKAGAGGNHSSFAANLLANYLIGTLGSTVVVAPTSPPAQITATAFPTIFPTNTTRPANSTSTPVPTQPKNQNLSLTPAEVATHNSLQNCWLIVSNKVYDVTSYITQHPGGVQIIVNYCGKEATTAFNTRGGTGSHSNTAKNLFNNYYIGDLNTSVPVVPTSTTAPQAPTNTPLPGSTSIPNPTATTAPSACTNLPSSVCSKYPGATRRSGSYEDNGSWEGEINTSSGSCRHIKVNSSGAISSDQNC